MRTPERLAPFVAGALLASPSLAAHYLPMTDLPLHEGAVGLLRHFGDPTYAPPELYRLNLGHPNQLFYVVAWLLSYAVGTLWAVKLVIACAQLAIFWMGTRLADHLGRSRWSVLLLAPLTLGFTYYWGLTTNLVGFAAFLGVLPSMDRLAAKPSLRAAAVASALLLLTFFAHESVFMMATGFVALLAFAYPFELRKTALRLAPIAFATALAIGHQIYASRFFTRATSVAPPKFPSLWTKFAGVPTVLFGSYDLPIQLALMGLSLVALTLFAVTRLRSKEPPAGAGVRPGTGDSNRSVMHWVHDVIQRYRYELTGFVFLAMYFAMPFNWRGATLLYERFLGPAWALLAICAGPRVAPPRLAKLVVGVIPVAILLVAWPQFVDAGATARDLDVIIAALPKNSAVTQVGVDRRIFGTRVYSATTGPARSVAERGGRAGLSLAMSPIAPVQVRPEYRWDEYSQRTIESASRALQPAHDLERFGWVIAQSRDLAIRPLLVAALVPDASLVMVQGEWLLFRSKHPQKPLTSADAPATNAETLIDRMRRIERGQLAAPETNEGVDQEPSP